MDATGYFTPRAFLIEQLFNESCSDFVKWVDHSNIHFTDFAGFFNKCVRISVTKYGREYIGIPWKEYIASILAATIPNVTPWQFELVTKSYQKRNIVNDLAPAPLYEWIIRFLLEQTRTDWVDWADKDNYQFVISDIQKMGDMYAKVNDKMRNCSLYFIKLLLDSYCRTGILKEIDKKSNNYQFNEIWYKQELKRGKKRINQEGALNWMLQAANSMTHFPDMTIDQSFFRW